MKWDAKRSGKKSQRQPSVLLAERQRMGGHPESQIPSHPL